MRRLKDFNEVIPEDDPDECDGDDVEYQYMEITSSDNDEDA